MPPLCRVLAGTLPPYRQNLRSCGARSTRHLEPGHVVLHSGYMRRFDPDDFVRSCIDALGHGDPVSSIRTAVGRAVSDPAALDATFPLPLQPGTRGALYRSPELLVTRLFFPPGFSTGLHDHTVAAVIGVWAGHEDNHMFEHMFERSPVALRPVGTHRVTVGEVLVLDPDAVHDVHAPEATHSAALHVYLGDIDALERSSWSAALEQHRFDPTDRLRLWAQMCVASGLMAEDPTMNGPLQTSGVASGPSDATTVEPVTRTATIGTR